MINNTIEIKDELKNKIKELMKKKEYKYKIHSMSSFVREAIYEKIKKER